MGGCFCCGQETKAYVFILWGHCGGGKHAGFDMELKHRGYPRVGSFCCDLMYSGNSNDSKQKLRGGGEKIPNPQETGMGYYLIEIVSL